MLTTLGHVLIFTFLIESKLDEKSYVSAKIKQENIYTQFFC